MQLEFEIVRKREWVDDAQVSRCFASYFRCLALHSRTMTPIFKVIYVSMTFALWLAVIHLRGQLLPIVQLALWNWKEIELRFHGTKFRRVADIIIKVRMHVVPVLMTPTPLCQEGSAESLTLFWKWGLMTPLCQDDDSLPHSHSVAPKNFSKVTGRRMTLRVSRWQYSKNENAWCIDDSIVSRQFRRVADIFFKWEESNHRLAE